MAKEEMSSAEITSVPVKAKPVLLAAMGHTLTSILQTEVNRPFTVNGFLAEAESLRNEHSHRYLGHILSRRTPIFDAMVKDLSSTGLALYVGKRRKYNDRLGVVHRNLSIVLKSLPNTEDVTLFDLIHNDKNKIVAVDYDWLEGLKVPVITDLRSTMSYQRHEMNARHEAEMERVSGYIKGFA
jgi:hypothetical protein